MSALGYRRVELRESRGTMRWVASVRAKRAESGRWNLSAVAEALGCEEESEDATHRLTATILIRLSPFYEDQLARLTGGFASS